MVKRGLGPIRKEDTNMKLSRYCRVGKAPMIRAIGIQSNYKETYYTEETVLDRAATGCYSCANYKNIDFYEYMPEEVQKMASDRCASCPYAVYKTITHEHHKYINEKNMYGFAPRLKTAALKLLLVYHFMSPDKNGVIQDISFKEIAEYIGCTVRTVHNSNEKLQDYGYIYFSENGAGYNIILPEYSTYALTADKGGRGYATLSRDFLDEIVKVTDLNQLRIFIRASLDADTIRNSIENVCVEKDFSSLRRFLPDYCKPGIIKKALARSTKLYTATFTDSAVYLSINKMYHGRQNYENEATKYTAMFTEYLTSLRKSICRVNQAVLNDQSADQHDTAFLSGAGVCSRFKLPSGKKLYADINFCKEDCRDLGILSTAYPVDAIKKCIGYIYEHYCYNLKGFKFGALIRSILKENENIVCNAVPG